MDEEEFRVRRQHVFGILAEDDERLRCNCGEHCNETIADHAAGHYRGCVYWYMCEAIRLTLKHYGKQ